MIDRIPFDALSEIFSFVWFGDIDSVACCSHYFHKSIREAPRFRRQMLSKLAQALNNIDVSITDLDASSARWLAQRFAIWPSTLDYRHLPTLVTSSIDTDHKNVRVHFCGPRLGGDRAVFADMHFPCLASSEFSWKVDNGRRDFASSLVPFSKIVFRSSKRCIDGSCVAYFEVFVHPPPEYVQRDPYYGRRLYHENRPTCVSVGLANPSFSSEGRMPGWDSRSFGYHGDDGHYFHGDGVGIEFGPPFGSGDTVGCGIVYPPLVRSGRLFFTKNGRYIGHIDLTPSFFNIPWFPVVGIDSYSFISSNFGERPFQFDVDAYECSLAATLQVSIRRACSDYTAEAINPHLGGGFTAFYQYLSRKINRSESGLSSPLRISLRQPASTKCCYQDIHLARRFLGPRLLSKLTQDDVILLHPHIAAAEDCSSSEVMRAEARREVMHYLSGRNSLSGVAAHPYFRLVKRRLPLVGENSPSNAVSDVEAFFDFLLTAARGDAETGSSEDESVWEDVDEWTSDEDEMDGDI
jgi:hypothetical protein